MRKKLVWYAVAVLILGLILLAVSCGGTTQAPEEEQKMEEPTIEEPKAEEPTTPTESPAAIPHTLEGRDNCLTCHGKDAFKPFPSDHAGRTNNTCTTCHQSEK